MVDTTSMKSKHREEARKPLRPTIARGLLLSGGDHVDLLRAVVQKFKATHRFQIDAMVTLPDHLHAVWTLPAGRLRLCEHGGG